MSTQDRLNYLLGQALQHVATAEELQELATLVREDAGGAVTQQLETRLLQELPDNVADGYDTAYWDDVASRILAADRPQSADEATPVVPFRRFRWLPAAAAAVLLAVGAYWLWKPAAPPPVTIAAAPAMKDVAPGGNKAVLTLADGTEVPLDSTGSGTLTQQGNTHILQPAGGQLLYTSSGATDVLQYNTLRTPRGGQFQVTLPDGTKVWLNAASSLKYPVAFTGAVRQVELTGEAYFEVARQAAMPFKVTVRTGQQNDSMEVAVLGTQFNIMAYADEAMVKTTLLEGAVKVSRNGNSRRLAPGQAAQLDKQQDLLTFQQTADTEEAVAWKNGLMQLEGKDIASVMRTIARWYNVDVVFKAPVAAHFHGIIPRSVPVSQVLKMLEMTGEVHFEIRDRQIIVSP